MVISQNASRALSRPALLATLAISLAGFASAQNQIVQTHPLNSYSRYLDGQWEGIKYASDGNVYFASSSQSAHHGAAFFKYNPATQQVTMLAEDITIICGEDPQTNPQGKIHSEIKEMHGWLFFTTHFGADERPNGIEGWTGAHLLGYRLADNGSNNYFGTPVGGFHDYGVIYPGYDAYSGIAVDPVQNYIYVFTTGRLAGQVSYVFRYNAVTDTQATRVNLGQVYGTYGASLSWFMDPAGDVWFAIFNDNGALHRIHHDTQIIDSYPNVLPAFIRQDSNTPDASHDRAVQWMAPISPTKALFTYNGGGMLYQFDSSLATANSVPTNAFTNLKWIGPSYIGAAVGNNRVFWYQRAGGAVGHQGCNTGDTTLPPACQDYHLMSVSLDPSTSYAITDHGLMLDQLGRTVWRTPAMATDGTNENVFLVGDWWTYDTSGNPIPGDQGVNNTLRYRYSGGVETFIDEPRGQFFAVAHTIMPTGSVSVAPLAVTLGAGQTQQFTATVHNSPGQAVNWSLNPAVGTISSAGLYQAPAVIGSGQTIAVKATNASNSNLFASASVTLQPASGGTATVQFVKTDTTTQGNWKSAYGSDGYNVLGDAAAYPAYATITPSGNSFWTWAQSTADIRGLQKSVAADRVAATWYSSSNFTLDVNLTDGNPHPLAIYAVDWDLQDRLQTVAIRDKQSGTLLDSRTLSGFNSGTYLVWNITGHVTIQVTRTSGVNAVISGLFIGNASTSPTAPSITQHPQDATVTAGQTAGFSVTATSGTVLSYQWQTQAPGGSSFSNIPGATLSSYTTPAMPVSDSGTQFRCVVTNSAGPVNSDAATLTVQPAAPGPGGTAFVTSKALGTLRNNYDGWIGMAIQVGSSPLTVNALGRIVVVGSSGMHLVKIVNAASGVDVPGGSVPVATAGGVPGTFAYASLASPVTLNAGATYYIVSLEGSNADPWYNFDSTIQTTSTATATAAVYGTGSSLFTIGSPGQTYGPVDFKYDVGSGGGGPPAAPVITQDPVSATVTAGQTAIFSVTATSTVSVTYQWQSKASGGSSFADIAGATQSSYTTPATQIADSGAQFRCVVTNSGGPATSNAATLTVNPAAPGGSGTAFVTSRTLGTPRNNYSGWVGMAIQVGSSPLTVNALGRIVIAGSSGTHVVKIVQAASGADVPGGSVQVATAGAVPGSFKYVTLASPIVLNAAAVYYVVSQENTNGDQWYDYNNTIIQTTNAATATSAVYGAASYSVIGSPGQIYGPVDFQYALGSGGGGPPPAIPVITEHPSSATVTAGQTATFSVTATSATTLSYQWQSKAPGGSTFADIAGATQSSYTTPATQISDSGTEFRCVVSNSGGPATSNPATLTVQPAAPGGPAAFVTSKVFGTPRNNHNGWVGMAIRVGSSPLIVNALGRIVVPGNTGTHLVKIVEAASGVDVSGGSVSVPTSGGAPGSFAYANLANPVALNAGAFYYILSLEVSGGDSWYDYNNTIVQTTNAATVSSAVYTIGASYFVIGSTGQTYGPADFKYTVSSGGGAPATPLITHHPASASVLVGQTATFSVTASSSTALSYQWQVQAPGASGFTDIPGATQSAYTTAAAQIPDHGTQFRSIATNDGGPVNSNAATLAVLSGTNTFVTSFTQGTPRNDFDGWVGMTLTVGANPLVVSSLGRVCIAGNSGTHLVKFVIASTEADVPGSVVSVNMAGCVPGQFVYGALASLITLQPGTGYYLASQETLGADQWYDHGPVTSTNAATVNDSIYSPNGSYWKVIHHQNMSYGPPNFQYSVGTPPPPDTNPPFVTAYNSSRPLRNDFSGWVGMQLTVGASPITVSSLGRIFVTGNSATHIVKLVRASDGVDVAGGSISLIMAGGTAGQFSYASLPSPVTLQANTSYYLVSQEVIGGDRWYDYGIVSASSTATVNNAVYGAGGIWHAFGGANESYVPVNFK